MEMNEKDTGVQKNPVDPEMSNEQLESTTATSESKSKIIISFLDSIIQLCKTYINKMLTNLRRDNRSLVTGLAVVSAISCFLTASFAYFTQNHPKSQSNYLYEEAPSNIDDFYYQYSIEPYGNDPQPFYFESNNYPTIIDEIQNIFDELFDEVSHHFFQPYNESNGLDNKLQEF